MKIGVELILKDCEILGFVIFQFYGNVFMVLFSSVFQYFIGWHGAGLVNYQKSMWSSGTTSQPVTLCLREDDSGFVRKGKRV